jgi:succinate dehydrogenase / fumarate reductase flavoprotein subunit
MAEAVIFATGGAGRLYGNTTNALINTGMGMAVPYWAGVPLKDMEFIQFHPTTLFGKNILITEGARGEGGFLLNNKGERFLANYADSRKAMEVAPRDIISRNMTKEILEGRGFEGAYLHLDLRHLGKERIMTRLPGIREICMEFAGIDPIEEPIPVLPGQHYTMGGIDCSTDCETQVKGFYAAGEAACVSVHGANRLGGNSLLDTLVFGQIAGGRAAEYVQGKAQREQGKKALEEALKGTEEKIEKILQPVGKELPVRISQIRDEMQAVMDKKVGIFRDARGLEEARDRLKELKDIYNGTKIDYRGRVWNQALITALELEGSLDVAEAVVAGALAREESRGSHFRTDFPKRDDKNWLRHTLCSFTPEGPQLEYSEVRPGPFKIEERRY